MGKGSRWRKTDYKKYFENWDNIKKSKREKAKEEVKTKSKTIYKY
jgi:hypothetical protein